jgi:predicted ATPase/class 3 adenylate cyclase
VTALPEGDVTFLFTDIQGSTQMLARLKGLYGEVLGMHRAILRRAFDEHGGHEVDTQGDSFLVAFGKPDDAIAAAVGAQRGLFEQEWPQDEQVLVRMGIHSGRPLVVDDHYVGLDLHFAARVMGAAHGGQIVVTRNTYTQALKSLDSDMSFKNLGRHRFKDIESAEQIFQVLAPGLPDVFPPLKSARPPTNIPRHAGELIGRTEALKQVRRLLEEEKARVLTLTGPGGTGKTRLAAAAAIEVSETFVDGAFFVDLTSAQDVHQVEATIASSLQVPLVDGSPPIEQLAEFIGDKQLLLVLDNFEHVLEAARVVSDLSRKCRDLCVLTTSRSPLGLSGEREYQVGPLDLPRNETLESVLDSEAGRLFIERAQAVKASFEPTQENAAAITQVCRLLDGLPLAIELAAARTKLFSPEKLLSRLDDRLKLLSGTSADTPERHQTLRATIEWSYNLLNEEEKRFFSRMSVFSGGASIEAIEALFLDDDVLELLTAMVNHSLVRQADDDDREARFTMLQTIRDYAAGLFAQDPARSDVRDRHALYFLNLAENSEAADMEDITPELDNLRASLEWLIEAESFESHRDRNQALRLSIALGSYWYRHGLAAEGFEWLSKAIEISPLSPVELRARALRLLGVMKESQRELDTAAEFFEQALALFKEAGDRAGEAACLNSLGVTARSRNDPDEADRHFKAALEIRRSIGDEVGVSASLSNLAIVALDRKDARQSIPLLEEALTIDKKRGDEWGVACGFLNLGVAKMDLQGADESRPLIQESLKGFTRCGDPDGTAEAIESLGGIAAMEREPVRCVRLLAAAQAMRRKHRLPSAEPDRARIDRWLEVARGLLDEESFDAAWREGSQIEFDEAVEYAFSS